MKILKVTLIAFICLATPLRAQEGSGLTKLLVVAGYDLNDLNHAEVLDLANAGAECGLPPAYPNNVFGVAGGLLNGQTPMVCGGYHCCGSDYRDDCYVLKENEWVPTSLMSTQRLWLSSTPYPLQDSKMGLMMSGGNKLDVPAQDTTEIFVPSDVDEEIGSWMSGPNLPIALEEHCLVTIDSNTIMAIGGKTPPSTRTERTFFLDIPTQQWTDGPNLIGRRDGHGCGLFKDQSSGKTYVIAAGGFDGLVIVDSVELLDLENRDAWIGGPLLPFSLHNGKIIQDTTGSVIMVGGERGNDYKFSDKLYKLDSIESGWSEMPHTLKVARNNHAAFLVPDDAVVCK